MQFVTIVETNHKERETFIHYCQLHGNEDELGKLMRVIHQSDGGDELDGDVSTFMCCTTRMSEAVADEHAKLSYGCFARMFQKHTGVFKCPTLGSPRDSLQAAQVLDNFFYACKLGTYFRNT